MAEGGRFGYAIVGCGWVSSAHAWGAQALREEGVRLVAVSDVDEARGRALADRFGGPDVCTDYRDVLGREDVDAVSVCLPDFLHEEVALAAAAARKHVLCEKPLAVDIESADRMVLAFEAAGLGLGLVMNHRYAPDNIRVKRALSAGSLGRPLLGSVVHSSCLSGDPSGTSPWRGRRGRAAGGILTTQAIHFLDLLLWFLGPVRSVHATVDSLVGTSPDFEDTAALALRLRSGALATLATTNGAPITDDFTGTRIEVHCTDGYAALEGDVIRHASLREGAALPDVSLPAAPDGAEEIVFGLGHVHEVVDFLRAIRRGDPPPIPGIDGRHLTAVFEAAYASAREGKEIEIDEPFAAYANTRCDASLLGGSESGR